MPGCESRSLSDSRSKMRARPRRTLHPPSGGAAAARLFDRITAADAPCIESKAAPAAPLARRQRRALALARPRPAHAGPKPQSGDPAGSHGRQHGVRASVALAPDCPARGHSVEVAPYGRVACDRLRRTSTRRPLARNLADARGTEQARPRGGAPLRRRFHVSNDH